MGFKEQNNEGLTYGNQSKSLFDVEDPSPVSYNPDMYDKKIKDRENSRKHERSKVGILGYLFGVSSCVPNNIAGLVVFLLLIYGVLYSFYFYEEKDLGNVWSIVSPMMTLALGYLFGKK